MPPLEPLDNRYDAVTVDTVCTRIMRYLVTGRDRNRTEQSIVQWLIRFWPDSFGCIERLLQIDGISFICEAIQDQDQALQQLLSEEQAAKVVFGALQVLAEVEARNGIDNYCGSRDDYYYKSERAVGIVSCLKSRDSVESLLKEITGLVKPIDARLQQLSAKLGTRLIVFPNDQYENLFDDVVRSCLSYTTDRFGRRVASLNWDCIYPWAFPLVALSYNNNPDTDRYTPRECLERRIAELEATGNEQSRTQDCNRSIWWLKHAQIVIRRGPANRIFVAPLEGPQEFETFPMVDIDPRRNRRGPLAPQAEFFTCPHCNTARMELVETDNEIILGIGRRWCNCGICGLRSWDYWKCSNRNCQWLAMDEDIAHHPDHAKLIEVPGAQNWREQPLKVWLFNGQGG